MVLPWRVCKALNATTMSSINSVPQLDGAVPAARHHPRGHGRVPHAAHDDAVVCLEHAVVFHLLPVPEPQLAIQISRHHPLAICGESRRDRVARIQVALELPLALELEAPERLVRDDLVVHGLAYQHLLPRAERDSGHRVHRGLRDVLDDDGDAILPDEDLLIVRGSQQPFAVLAEGHRVDGSHVLVVLLDDAGRVGIPLHCLLVRAPSDNDVLLRRIGMHGHTEVGFLVSERGDDLSSLSIPILDVLVVRNAIKSLPISSKIDIAHALVVAHIRPQALALVLEIPDLDSAIHTGRQQQVRRIREPADLVDSHGVARPCVEPLLGQKALLVVHILGGQRRLVLDPGAACIVGLFVAVEERGDALLRLPLLALDGPLFLPLPGDLVLAQAYVLLDFLRDGPGVLEAAPLPCGLPGHDVRGHACAILVLLGILLLLLLLIALPSRHRRAGAGGARQLSPLGRGRHGRGLVPDAPAVLRLLLRALEDLLAASISGRIRGISIVMEGEVLLVEGKVVHPHLLNMSQLVVVELLL
mmetsp:Transcript_130797/g.419483  ORF Transcript_130797/g.419483 Transcript_130797/m.419483 type:complete len:530 (-) Transcript_130797:367-1956(-)